MSICRISIKQMVSDNVCFANVPHDSAALITYPSASHVWLYLLRKPDTWVIREKDVRQALGIGRRVYQRAMRELRRVGLIAERVVRSSTLQCIQSTELECRMMPLKPRKRDTNRAANPVNSPQVTLRDRHKTYLLSKDVENLSKEEEIVTNVTNLGGSSSLEESILQVEKRNAERLARNSQGDKIIKKTTLALWNKTVATHKDLTNGVVASPSITFVLAKNTKNLDLSPGEWRDVLVFSVEYWERLRVTQFSWMHESPMPNVPTFSFWQFMFKHFLEAYRHRNETRGAFAVMARHGAIGTTDTKEVRSLREYNAQLLKEKRADAAKVDQALNERRRERMDTAKLRDENKQLKRRARKPVNLDDDIESWEQRNNES